MFYNNKPIEKTEPIFCETPSKEIKNLILGLPIHAIEEKEFFDEPGVRAERNFDTDKTQLTDGVYSSDVKFQNPEWFHLNRGGGRVITFKLPYICAVSGFSVSALRNDAFGIRTPRYLKVRVSTDGENFQTVYDNPDTRSWRDLRVHKSVGEFEPVKARYVQIVVEVLQHVYLDEIEILGCTDASNAADVIPNDIPLWNEYPGPVEYHAYPDADVVGAENITLSYNFCSAESEKCLKTEEDYLPLIAYLDKEGNIVDTFMDGVLYLPDVTFDHDPKGACCAEGWKNYVNSIYLPNRNLDALNKTVKKVKDALNLPDHKVSIYYPLLYTFTAPEVFGELDGETIIFDSFEARKKAVRWLVDSYIARHDESVYDNTELKGFYWFEEALNPTDRYEEETIRYICEYIHSKGYKCFWIPYYCAEGYENWKRYGFDTACMQPNYAFDGDIPKTRLYDTAREAKRVGMCVELEVWKIQEDENGNIDNPGNIEKFIDYLEVGAETGYMNTVKMYYHGSQISECISNGWKSKNARYREMYDMCYKFAKCKLEVNK